MIESQVNIIIIIAIVALTKAKLLSPWFAATVLLVIMFMQVFPGGIVVNIT